MNGTNVTDDRHRMSMPTPVSLLLTALLLCGMISSVGCDETPEQDGTDSTRGESPASTFPDTTGLPSFSGDAAYDMVARQVAFGPRNPGSDGATQALDFFVEELGKYAATVERQEFTHVGYGEEEFTMTNVIAAFNPEATTRVLLCAHWDTRPRSDWDADAEDLEKPILGANDGGSGVGVLLELARIMKKNPPPIGVDIVLFDGEDYGHDDVDGMDRYFLGAKHFAKTAPATYRPVFGILLDIVGDHDARFLKEQYSLQYAGSVVELVWSAAGHLGLRTFVQQSGGAISDDHLPLNQIARIPTIDIIDGALVGHNDPDPRRQYWHTSDDDMDNISSKTLGEVGRLLTYIIYRVVPDQKTKSGGTA